MNKILQINVKPNVFNEHGLPKIPVDDVFVSNMGVSGDYNNYRTNKKDRNPDMAVLLYPDESIKELNGENWPIKRGDIGENFTISGILHSHFSPGQQFQLGECILEISFECDPCHNLAVLPYVGEDKLNEFIKTLMHRRGWYAKVIKEGTVKTGDPIQQLK
ncbi:MAG: MOSC domain-containing protein [Candidatus Marinimicrobia bacterium]|jgi:MOSC domain-containing protein YiiM|nr:MOSC domain-containing protein [Candidatus Neomarinimicrobiota bacterium]MBT3937777.1 MOSC domain-containing protein [Candidatus Neomarinimicrobiota bacterium]MBT3962333.1 MOSC domain-containing protein [Candidatus Neomarinimicrobiota bacterium]MBT4382586.1 MOSC domain-containing protein [Candidatus Neomarinimicrobiota bacterium]MBT4635193.1 MOSC domain-containing protein [Candidatus Neomarinimicrobiota bacterium]|tara:strand:+ start:299 stop:781 length:483 start_codon:yes stop_codon:yes gene_type:complete